MIERTRRPPDHDDDGKARTSQPRTASALTVQRTAGDRSSTAHLQRMLTVGAVDDPAEREADAFADRVEQLLQAPGGEIAGPALAEDRTAARRATATPAATPLDGQPAPDGVQQGIREASGGGSSLPASLQKPLEGALGVDLSKTRIHTDDRADELSAAVQARAFTVGNDVFFAKGEYAPTSTEGRHVLAHELAHVAQHSSAEEPGAAKRMPVTTIRRITDEQSEQLMGRAASLDYNALTDIAAKAPLLVKIDKNPGDPIEKDNLKQLILTSTVAVDKLDALVNDPQQLRKIALKGKQRSSGQVFSLIDSCRAIFNDFYRFEGNNSQAWAKGGLGGAADKYDKSGKSDFGLTHKEKGSGLFGTGAFARTKTRTHSMKDVMNLVSAVAGVNLRVAMSPTSMPKSSGDVAPTRPKVGVVGAGPVGLLAALESRMQGADVVLFEARGDEYSRRQVLALDKSTEQKLTKFGVKYDLLESGAKGQGNLVAVKYIEKALRERALELGIEIRTDWTLVGAKKKEGETQTEAMFQQGRDPKKAQVRSEKVDLLVVAAGAGVAKANKYTGVCIGDELGIQYDVQEAKDYAAVGLFQNTTTGNTKDKDDNRWAYRFNTPKVTYILRQIPPDLYEQFSDQKDGKAKLEAFIRDRAKNHFQMGDAALAKDRNKLNQFAPNIGVFPIEIQQARTFVNTELNALVIGDSAATPHPHSGSGFNTGVRELDALSDVVAALRMLVLAANDPKEKRKGVRLDEDSPDQVKAALDEYNRQMKQLTDVMVAKATKILAEQHAKYLTEAIASLEEQAGSYLMSDLVAGRKVDEIKKIAAAVLAKDSKYTNDQVLEFLVQAQRDIAKIRREYLSNRALALGTG